MQRSLKTLSFRTPLWWVLTLSLGACGGGGGGGGSAKAPGQDSGAGPRAPVLADPTLQLDLNQDPPDEESSHPSNPLTIGSKTFFNADDSVHGEELWVTDGSTSGTHLVYDLNPGRDESNLWNFTAFRARLFFTAFRPGYGLELWESDCTEDGTRIVADLEPGPDHASPGPLIVYQQRLFFAAYTHDTGREVWCHDGKEVRLVKDLVKGPEGSSPGSFQVFGGLLYFRAVTEKEGSELWRTDGTAGGTVMVDDIDPGAGSSSPSQLTPLGDKLFFVASTASEGREIYYTDGTLTVGYDLEPGPSGSSPNNFLVLGDRLIFEANTSLYGRELWVSSGGAPALLYDIYPGQSSSSPGTLVHGGDFALFAATDPQEKSVWRTDGTANGTSSLADVAPGDEDLFEGLLVDERLYLSMSTESEGRQLWESDGTQSGTVKVSTVDPTGIQRPRHFAALDGRLLFQGDGGNRGRELWVSEGSEATTRRLKNIHREQGSSHPSEIISSPQGLAYRAFTEVTGQELWQLDRDRVTLVADIYPGSSGAFPEDLIALGEHVFFNAYDGGVIGRELWQWTGDDLTAYDLYSGAQSSSPGRPVVYQDMLVFDAIDALTGRDLFRTNGSGPPELIHDFGDYSQNPVVSGELVYFVASENGDRELWKYDGVDVTQVKDIHPAGDSDPRDLVDAGGLLFFVADDGVNGAQIWRTDGTLNGTTRLTDQSHGFYQLDAVAAGDLLFYKARTDAKGRELWVSDGTTDGTRLLKDIVKGPGSSLDLEGERGVALDGRFFFAASDPEHGEELWVSDGTRQGTRRVVELVQGPDSSAPHNLTAIPELGLIVFAAFEPETGVEMWESDGTAAGTHRLTDIAPGASPSNPHGFAHHDGRVYFQASDGTTGRELWFVSVNKK